VRGSGKAASPHQGSAEVRRLRPCRPGRSGAGNGPVLGQPATPAGPVVDTPPGPRWTRRPT